MDDPREAKSCLYDFRVDVLPHRRLKLFCEPLESSEIVVNIIEEASVSTSLLLPQPWIIRLGVL